MEHSVLNYGRIIKNNKIVNLEKLYCVDRIYNKSIVRSTIDADLYCLDTYSTLVNINYIKKLLKPGRSFQAKSFVFASTSLTTINFRTFLVGKKQQQTTAVNIIKNLILFKKSAFTRLLIYSTLKKARGGYAAYANGLRGFIKKKEAIFFRMYFMANKILLVNNLYMPFFEIKAYLGLQKYKRTIRKLARKPYRKNREKRKKIYFIFRFLKQQL
jgi:hypothetical protein